MPVVVPILMKGSTPRDATHAGEGDMALPNAFYLEMLEPWTPPKMPQDWPWGSGLAVIVRRCCTPSISAAAWAASAPTGLGTVWVWVEWRRQVPYKTHNCPVPALHGLLGRGHAAACRGSPVVHRLA